MGGQVTLPSGAFTCRESIVHLNQLPLRKVEFSYMHGINYFLNVNVQMHCYVFIW